MATVAQLVRASVCDTGGRGFESPQSPHLEILQFLKYPNGSKTLYETTFCHHIEKFATVLKKIENNCELFFVKSEIFSFENIKNVV